MELVLRAIEALGLVLMERYDESTAARYGLT
jgi:hypothetical protein